MLQRKLTATLVALCLLLTGCGIPLTVPTPSNGNDYNELVKKYNALLGTSYRAQQESEKELLALEDLDVTLSEYATSTGEVVMTSDRLVVQLSDITATALEAQVKVTTELHRRAVNKLTALEQQILVLWSGLADNAALVYQLGDAKKNELLEKKRRYERLSSTLSGIRSLLTQDQKTILAYAHSKSQVYARLTGNKAPMVQSIPQIVPTARDQEVAAAVGAKDSGWVRDTTGKLLPLSDAKAVTEYATRNGFSVQAAEDGVILSSKTGGSVGFSKTAASLPVSISDSISHFKQQLNKNSDALEIAFIVDYSGSMADDIQGVIDGLLSIVTELENVKKAGRDIRIAIVTFGEPKRELVEQDFTNDMVKTGTTLKRLLAEYAKKNHSTNPGEASFHGMALAAKGLSWKGANRMSIVITDEESYELRTGMTQFVDDTLKALANQNIQNRIYTLIVSQ